MVRDTKNSSPPNHTGILAPDGRVRTSASSSATTPPPAHGRFKLHFLLLQKDKLCQTDTVWGDGVLAREAIDGLLASEVTNFSWCTKHWRAAAASCSDGDEIWKVAFFQASCGSLHPFLNLDSVPNNLYYQYMFTVQIMALRLGGLQYN